ncbi:MAG: TIGR03943 family protein [Chloroflexota bacterium]
MIEKWWANWEMVERWVKTAVLLLLGLFLYTRVTSGVVSYYINERFFTLTLVAGMGFVVLGLSYFRQWLGSQEENHDHEHNHNHDHDHGLTWLGVLIVMLPLLLGWLVPPRPLGATAVFNREINFGTDPIKPLAAPGGNEAMGIIAGERNILDWLGEFQRSGDPAALAGQTANVIGFVYRDDRFAADEFMVARFTVSCCVADAAPVGLIVRWPAGAELPTDQWVAVQGRFEVGVFNGRSMPILVAETITKTEQPPQPYLHL